MGFISGKGYIFNICTYYITDCGLRLKLWHTRNKMNISRLLRGEEGVPGRCSATGAGFCGEAFDPEVPSRQKTAQLTLIYCMREES